jgi:ABC-type phosphate/phosphonate transport system substrate-binding protein
MTSSRQIRFPRELPRRRWTAGVPGLLVLLAGSRLLASGASAAPEAAPPVPFHFAFSASVVIGLNEADAIAAMDVWAHAVITTRGIDAQPVPRFYPNLPALLLAFRRGEIDAVSLTTPEYLELAKTEATDHLLNASFAGKIGEEYLLLVGRQSPFTRLADLRQRTLLIFANPRMALAEPWLDTILLRDHFVLATRFFGSVHRPDRLVKTVLPVFFGQADACLVTRRGYESMCELNPQLAAQLRVLVASPALVPGLLCFRRSYTPPFKARLVSALVELDQAPGGRQLLTLFQCDQILPGTEAALDPARALLAERERRLQAVAAPDNAGHSSP